MNGPILVPVDGSEPSLRAVDEAAELAKVAGTGIVVAHVVDPAKAAMLTYGNPQFVAGCLDAIREEGRELLEAARVRARGHVERVETRLIQGSPGQEIVKLAREIGATWIVMGSHGRTGLARLLVGSVAEDVLRHAGVPVLIVPLERKARRAHDAPHAETVAG
ncbi:MAG TPA: universal stress protein [Candidatus Acidoferrales bacterium]|nr:universal stress protein [Candidatus Acidoferrales bacterium]